MEFSKHTQKRRDLCNKPPVKPPSASTTVSFCQYFIIYVHVSCILLLFWRKCCHWLYGPPPHQTIPKSSSLVPVDVTLFGNSHDVMSSVQRRSDGYSADPHPGLTTSVRTIFLVDVPRREEGHQNNL